MALPTGLSPALIGKVVTVQILKRNEAGSDTLEAGSLEKYVGTLQSYYHREEAFAFSLVGDVGPRAIAYAQHHIEFHPYEKKFRIG